MSTVLTSKPYAIAVAKRFSRVYIVFDDAHDANIKNGMLDVSLGGVNVVPLSYQSCLMALFHDSVADVKELCSFTVNRQVVKPTIIHLDEQRVLISAVDEFQLYCRSELQNVTGCRLCIYTVPCGCAVVYPDAIIPATVSKCLPGISNMTKLHGFNMIVLQQFFEPLHLGSLLGSTALEQELEAELPNFMTYEHSQQQHLAADQKYQYDLTKLANLTKQDTLAYHSLAASLGHDFARNAEELQINNLYDYTSWQFWIMVITSVFAVLALLLSASLWIRFRILAAALAVTRAVPTAHAQSPIRLSYFTSTHTPTMQDVAADSNAASYWQEFNNYYVAAIVVVLLLLVFAWYCNCMCKRRPCVNWVFCLNIGNGDESLIVPIQTMPNNPYYYHFVATSFIQSMALKSECCTFWLNINWPSLSMVYWPNDTIIHLKKRICLPAWQGRILKRIMSTEYWCLPVGTMAGRLFYLALQHDTSDREPSHSIPYLNAIQTPNLDPTAPAIPLTALYPSLPSQNSAETQESAM